MRLFTAIFILLTSTTAFSASVSVKSEPKNGFIKTSVYNISSVAMTYEGLEIRVQGNPVCNISQQFLETNNLNGFELFQILPSVDFDFVVECEMDERNKNGGYKLPFAQKIRPRLEP